MNNTSISRYRKIFLVSILFFCIFWPRLAFATCQPGHEGPPEGGPAPSTSSGETVTEKPKPTIPKEELLGTIFGIGEETTPTRPITKRPTTPETTEIPLVTVPESECCEFTSLSIRNVWRQNQDIEVIVAGQSRIIHPNSTHTFSGNLGECVRITVKSTDPSAQHLLIEDVPVCCKDLKKGRYPRFFSISIVNFTYKTKVCVGGQAPPPPVVEKPPPKPQPPKPPKTPEIPETPEPPRAPAPGGVVTTPPTTPTTPETPTPTTTVPEELPLRLGIDITECDPAWRPRSVNSTTFTAKIYRWDYTLGRWVYPGPPRVITFRLSDVSREKGIALNKEDRTTPDLYFPPQLNFFVTDSAGAHGDITYYQTAFTTRAVTSATVTVDSDDFGSWGSIKATAPNCELIAPNGPVGIPWDRNGNQIADRQPQDDGGAPPRKDGDNTPRLDGHDGDGFSNYEEYRGFFVQGTWTDTSITDKDLFIFKEIAPGIAPFPAASGITTHLILQNEYDGDRVVNFNRGHATRVAQHGLHIVNRALPIDPYVLGMVTDFGPPVNCEAVQIDLAKVNPNLNRTIAHELGHAVCARHHGDGSIKTYIYTPEWNWYYNNRVYYALRGTAGMLCGMPRPGYFGVGYRGKQYSGNVNCIMKYVGVHVWEDLTTERYACWPNPDIVGSIFCNSSAGTGYNAGNSHAGDASLGNCLGQMRVCDEGMLRRAWNAFLDWIE